MSSGPSAPDTAAGAELLRACAGVSHDAVKLRDCAADVHDWPDVVRRADWHGVLPLVARRLVAECRDLLPPATADTLRSGAETIAWRNLSLTAQMLEIVDALRDAGLRAVPFKGPALAQAAYGDLGLRRYGDLDFLLASADVLAAKAALAGLHYRPDVDLADRDDRVLRSYGSEIVLRRDDTMVEIHWRLAPAYFSCALTVEALLDRAIEGHVERRRIPALSNEDQVLALCVHGAKDGWERLIWLADVAALLRRLTIDWPLLLDRAAALGLNRILLTALGAARAGLGSALPADVIAEMDRDPKVIPLVRTVLRRLDHAPLQSLSGPAQAGFHLQSRERLRDRMRYSARLLATPTLEDYGLAGPLASVPGVPGLVRPLRLAAKYGGKLMQSRKRSPAAEAPSA